LPRTRDRSSSPATRTVFARRSRNTREVTGNVCHYDNRQETATRTGLCETVPQTRQSTGQRMPHYEKRIRNRHAGTCAKSWPATREITVNVCHYETSPSQTATRTVVRDVPPRALGDRQLCMLQAGACARPRANDRLRDRGQEKVQMLPETYCRPMGSYLRERFGVPVGTKCASL